MEATLGHTILTPPPTTFHLLPFPQQLSQTHLHRTNFMYCTGVCLEMNMNEGMEAAVDLCTILHTIYYIGPQGVDNVNTCSFFIICITMLLQKMQIFFQVLILKNQYTLISILDIGCTKMLFLSRVSIFDPINTTTMVLLNIADNRK